jgi:hypothetical protein
MKPSRVITCLILWALYGVSWWWAASTQITTVVDQDDIKDLTTVPSLWWYNSSKINHDIGLTLEQEIFKMVFKPDETNDF